MNLLSIFKFKRTQKEIPKETMDLYKINILQPKNENEHSPPAVSIIMLVTLSTFNYVIIIYSYLLFRGWCLIVLKTFQNPKRILSPPIPR